MTAYLIEYCGGYLCSPIRDSRIPQFAFYCEASMIFVQVVEKGATCHVCGGEEVNNLKFSGKLLAVKIQNMVQNMIQTKILQNPSQPITEPEIFTNEKIMQKSSQPITGRVHGGGRRWFLR